LNEHLEDEHVDDVDLAPAAFNEADLAATVEALDRAVVLRGRIEGPDLVASDAWRALPVEEMPVQQTFVRVTEQQGDHCVAPVCPPISAVVLNAGLEVPLRAVDLSRAASTALDRTWLENRVFARGAVLAGAFVGAPDVAGIDHFVVSQVFIPIRDRTAPCEPMRARRCTPGTVDVYGRDADRCAVPMGCVVPRACAASPPDCAPGYVLRSWRSVRGGCLDFACDPGFLPK
jgi:hypothetical protein